MHSDFLYQGDQLATLSFPLGGIGSGSVGLNGNGHLSHWEIFNRPNKNTDLGFSHFAVKAQQDGKLLDARVLQSPPCPPYTGVGDFRDHGFGFGPERSTLAGMPCFAKNTFSAGFPLASLDFEDEHFPGKVKLSAFNPMIPLQDRDSSLPAAFFTLEVENTAKDAIDYTFALTLSNPHPDKHIHRDLSRGNIGAVLLSREQDMTHPSDGEMVMAAQGGDFQVQEYWYRGSWYDGLSMFWRNFAAAEELKPRSYPDGGQGSDSATLAVKVHAKPGETARARFVITWYFPNCYRYWGNGPEETAWKNYYATQWASAGEVAWEAMDRWDELEAGTRRFHDALFSCTIPDAALDAASANLEVLKSATVLRLEDGSFYGWEGLNSHSGSCEGSCQHVWNYAYALPYLFPKLERSMRELDYTYNLGPDGDMTFRVQLPLGSPRWNFRPCVDGQMGSVMKCYREWKLSGDTEWLRRWWPGIKASLEFAWNPNNPDRWDPDKQGVITGRQHHTLDMELFGPNSWLQGFYLGALKAGAAMARALGDPDADTYQALFEKGKAWTDEHLFNGRYYGQQIDLQNREILKQYSGNPLDGVWDPANTYWNEETGEMKYQLGDGCIIDQVLAQWHANLMGLGEIFDPGQTEKALLSIYQYNYKSRLGDCANPCRIFGLGDEAGTCICSFPEGAYEPAIAVPYAQECMHGFEYQAACHLIQMGHVKEGMKMVKAVRDRYDGRRRNPFNEMECGSNYARSMASFALIPAFAGFSFDMTARRLGFNPVEKGDFTTFFSVDSAWGQFSCQGGVAMLTVLGGQLCLDALSLPMTVSRVIAGGKDLPFTQNGTEVTFSCRLGSGETLMLLAGD